MVQVPELYCNTEESQTKADVNILVLKDLLPVFGEGCSGLGYSTSFKRVGQMDLTSKVAVTWCQSKSITPVRIVNGICKQGSLGLKYFKRRASVPRPRSRKMQSVFPSLKFGKSPRCQQRSKSKPLRNSTLEISVCRF